MTQIRKTIRIGTRGSVLAKVQAGMAASALKERHRDLNVEIVVIETRGDAVTDRPIDRIGGQGVFTKEIEQALLAGTIDLAVHSMKDMPTESPIGLTVAAVLKRNDPRDALVGATIEQLRQANDTRTIGTGSLRRTAQLKAMFTNVTTVGIRGNVDTRLRKVREGSVDGAVLAMAGLARLGRANEADDVFDVDAMMPAPAQGVLALQIRIDDDTMAGLLDPINCVATQQCATAERSFLRCLGGGCHVPVGAIAMIDENVLELKVRVITPDGRKIVEGLRRGLPQAAQHVGQELAFALIDKGADEIMDALGDRQEGLHNE